MKRKRILINLISIIVGGLLGYFYFRAFGCPTGACPMKSSPFYYILFGCGVAYVVSDFIADKVLKRYTKDKKEE